MGLYAPLYFAGTLHLCFPGYVFLKVLSMAVAPTPQLMEHSRAQTLSSAAQLAFSLSAIILNGCSPSQRRLGITEVSTSAQLKPNDKTLRCPLRGQRKVYGFYT